MNFNGKPRVKIIEDDTDYLSQSLGITEERRIELAGMCSKVFDKHFVNNDKDHTDLRDVFIEMSEFCTHPNELSYAMFSIGYNLSAYERMMTAKKMLSMLKGSLGMDDKED